MAYVTLIICKKKVQLPLSDFLTPLASKTVAGVKLLFLMTLEVAHFYPPASNRPYCASVRPLKTTFEFLLECFVKRSTASYIFKFIKLDQSLCILETLVLYHLNKNFKCQNKIISRSQILQNVAWINIILYWKFWRKYWSTARESTLMQNFK